MIAAIVVAAGKGSRMGGPVAKQYLALKNKALLAHSLNAFSACPQVDEIIVVLPPGHQQRFRDIVSPNLECSKALKLVQGGACRQESVFNGISALPEKSGPEDLVLIHDGARPLVSKDLIERCIRGALKWGACLPVIIPSDTVKQIADGGQVATTLDRRTIGLAQTPQAFRLGLIRKAHLWAHSTGLKVTDDAAILENMGEKVRAVPGSPENIKITFAEDLVLAEALLSMRQLPSASQRFIRETACRGREA